MTQPYEKSVPWTIFHITIALFQIKCKSYPHIFALEGNATPEVTIWTDIPVL